MASFDTITNREPLVPKEPKNEWLAMRRAGVVVLVGALVLPLVGCERRGGADDEYYGTIKETRRVLGDTDIPECLDGTIYDLDGSGAEWSDDLYGEYHEGATNAIIAITPESGGETLLLEQTLEANRPVGLFMSRLTNQKLMKDAGCNPATLPGGADVHFIKYNVKKNAKLLKEHVLFE